MAGGVLPSERANTWTSPSAVHALGVIRVAGDSPARGGVTPPWREVCLPPRRAFPSTTRFPRRDLVAPAATYWRSIRDVIVWYPLAKGYPRSCLTA